MIRVEELSVLNKLLKEVMNIVNGIRNSTRELFTEMMLSVASARVMEWPIVKAVTKTKIRFQSLTTYTAHNESTNKI
jgi:hypothetical protein